MTPVPVFNTFEWWELFLGGVCTLAIFSFLYKENPFYRFFEHFFIGLATAYGLVTAVREFFWPKVFQPLFGLDRPVFPDGTYATPYNMNNLWFLLPMAFGCLYYFILSRRWSWLAQLVIGFTFGVSAGLAFKGLFVEFLPQLFDSFRPVYVPGNLYQSVTNIVFLFTIVSAMSYFFFTFRSGSTGVIARTSLAGRWMLMGCFGAFFGSTIMARMALLVERLEFLINDWWWLFS